MQRRLAATVLAMVWLAGALMVSTDPAGAQEQPEKDRLRAALRALASEISPFTRDPEPLGQTARDATEWVRWLQGATDTWKPETADDGRPMRVAIERIEGAMRGARNDAARRNLLPPIEKDLEDKVAYCRAHGLTSRRRVTVLTKKGGVAEVSGLEVLYLEKFFENDPRATARQFRGFSSPASDELVPGRYVFWAREPEPSRKNGPRKDGRIALSSPSGPIEVLAP